MLGHPPRLGQRRGEGLVDHQMLAGIDRGHGVFGMQVIGGGQHHQCDRRVGQRLCIGTPGGGLRIQRAHFLLAAGDNGGQLQPRRRGDQGRVECLAGKAETNQRDAVRGHHASSAAGITRVFSESAGNSSVSSLAPTA